MTGAAFGIRREAVGAWFALHHALRALEDVGRAPVCQGDAKSWDGSAPPAVRREAAEACTHCPIRPACLAYAIAQDEPQGVFGGHDFTKPRRHLEVVA